MTTCETEPVTLRVLQKWHGAGNDFLVDVQEQGSDLWWTPERVRAVCDRATGVGADGLLVASVGAGVAMTIFNADGSLAEMSGNGARCLAAAVRRATRATWDELEVATAAGPKTVRLTMENGSGYGSVSMGEVTFADAPDGALGVAYVGNPHVVVADDLSWSDAQREEMAAKFAAQVGGANVEFLTVDGPGTLRIRVVERGVGWTRACGTGACAVAALARRDGFGANSTTVESSGGTLRVDLDGDQATLSGPVQFVANVEWLEA
jgi:diaminopimelate epimerase